MMRTRLTVALALCLALSAVALAPAHAEEVPGDYFGLVVPDVVTKDAEVPYGALNTMTSGVYWHHIERTPGRYSFDRLDALVAVAEARDVKPYVVLGGTPDFHVADGSPESTPRTRVPDLAAWESYVAAVMLRYGDRVDYQVWPEGNVKGNWTGGPEQLARLTHSAALIKEEVAPRATLLSTALVLRYRSQRRWIRKFLATEFAGRSVGTYVDALALDPYPLLDELPEDSMELVEWIRSAAARHGVHRPLWTAEINYGVGTVGEPRHSFSPWRSSAYVARTYLLSWAHEVRRVYWLFWGETLMGIDMTEGDGVTPTAAGRAFATVRHWMVGWTLRRYRVRDGVHTMTFRDDAGGRRVVWWRTQGRSRVTVPQEAVVLERLSGRRTVPEPGQRIRVTGRPVMVESSPA